MMMILQVAQHADDLDRATAFYSSLLETNPAARFDPPGLVFFNLDGVRLLLDDKAPSALVYLKVDDIDAAMLRVAHLGAEIVSQPHVIFRHADNAIGPAGHDERMAFFRDSEGNLVGLVEHRRAAQDTDAMK